MKKQLLFLLIFIHSLFIPAQESYYDDVNLYLTGLDLKIELANKITDTHTNYLDYTPDIWNASMNTDVNPSNSSEVLLVYGYENGTDSDVTNDREREIDNYGGSPGNWNREHVYPNSLATPDLNQGGINGPPNADGHNLRPCDAQRNSSRGNKLFIEGSGVSGATGNGWYPGDEWKGDVARIIMYMYLRYGSQCLPSNVGYGTSSETPDEMIDLFLQWNADDPVSEIERQRNIYHGNTSNTDAQGNRNPFIDNPILATRIWGGPQAEDLWGIYTDMDTEAPSIPVNLIASNITSYSIDLSWDASSDNVEVTSYEVYINGNLETSTTNTFYVITGLASNTTYDLTVLAKDIADNASDQSAPLTVTTLQDTEAPTTPTNVLITNETDVSFKVSWDASIDDTAVTSYEVYIDGTFNASTSNITYTVNNLQASTTYAVSVLAKDEANNMSEPSSPVNATTTDGSSVNADELLISEYVEGSSNNKAIEIANVTSGNINLSSYNLRRQSNGSGDWSAPFYLSGTLDIGNVIVIINGEANNETLINEADIVVENNASTNYGEPLNFNGNDPVGLFKNDDLIDIIGEFNGGSGNFAKDVTLRRKSSVAEPNTTFDLENEWDVYPKDNVDDIGNTHLTLSDSDMSMEIFKIYPNPTSLDYLTIESTDELKIEVYSVIGKKLHQAIVKTSNSKLNISELSRGIYFLKISNGQKTITRKFIKK